MAVTNPINYNLKTAFTLIELLVVIAIIGILSGLIIVGMSSTTQSANIAKAQIFSSSLRDSMMANLIAEWKFDELITATEGQSIKDSWNTNNCTLYTASDGLDKLKNGSNCIYGKCLSFDGTNDYIDCGNGNNLNITGSITIAAWTNINAIQFNEGSSASRSTIVSKLYVATDGGYMFLKEGWQSDRMELWISNGSVTRELASNTKLLPNKWYFVVMTLLGRDYKFYLNGNIDGSGTTDIDFSASTRNLLLGQRSGGGFYLNGLIDDIRIFNSSIPTSQIKEQYYSGISRLLSSGEIDKTDCVNRLKEI